MPKYADASPPLDDHAAGLLDWVASCAGGEVVRAERHAGGNHRIAWQIDVRRDGASPLPLFLALDPDGADGGNRRDGAVLEALAQTPIPVPRVVGRDGPGGALLMERIEGRSDAPCGEDLEPVMRDLIRWMALLHDIGPEALQIPELDVPESTEALALDQLASAEARYLATPVARHPIVDFGLGWLRRNVPRRVDRISLVHGDIGPGNLIYEGGVVRALVDWEIAHWGDPMEDLAALSVRDMATPIGSFSERLVEYEKAGGVAVDPTRLRYYRALVLVRNSLLIRLTLAGTPESDVPPQLEAFALLLRRAAVQALCEAEGIAFPDAGSAPSTGSIELPDTSLDDDRAWLPALAARSLADCTVRREEMGALADRFLQPVPMT
jgi:aminoglycoside phosphotransferase